MNNLKSIKILNKIFFDTLSLKLSSKQLTSKIYKAFQKEQINLRLVNDSQLSLTLSEITTEKDIEQIQNILKNTLPTASSLNKNSFQGIPKRLLKDQVITLNTLFLTPITRKLNFCDISIDFRSKELSLAHSMIPLRLLHNEAECCNRIKSSQLVRPFQTFILLPLLNRVKAI